MVNCVSHAAILQYNTAVLQFGSGRSQSEARDARLPPQRLHPNPLPQVFSSPGMPPVAHTAAKTEVGPVDAEIGSQTAPAATTTTLTVLEARPLDGPRGRRGSLYRSDIIVPTDQVPSNARSRLTDDCALSQRSIRKQKTE
jgi:hypothetical protein